MHSRVYRAFRLLWAVVAVGLLVFWLRTHDLPNHQFRTLWVAQAFVLSLLLIWRPDARFFARPAR